MAAGMYAGQQVNGWYYPKTWSLVGQTINSIGTPVASVTVNLFAAVGNVFQSTTTSDSGGNYTFLGLTTNTQAFFVNGFLAGSPDTFGTTDNNLTGS